MLGLPACPSARAHHPQAAGPAQAPERDPLLASAAADASAPLDSSAADAGAAWQRTRERRKTALLTAVYVVSTVTQVYVGIKTVSFHFDGHPTAGIASLLCATMVVINVELWSQKELVAQWTEDQGVLLPLVHAHRMYLKERFCMCDMCRARVDKAYNCETCNFDVCLDCFKKVRRCARG